MVKNRHLGQASRLFWQNQTPSGTLVLQTHVTEPKLRFKMPHKNFPPSVFNKLQAPSRMMGFRDEHTDTKEKSTSQGDGFYALDCHTEVAFGAVTKKDSDYNESRNVYLLI